MTRQNFDGWIPCGGQLRDLATRVASLDFSCFGNPKYLPHNFLANGEVGGAWHKPASYSLPEIREWKSNYRSNPPLTLYEEHGFAHVNGPLSRRGMALLFDPFVDAFLAAHLHRSGSIPRDCTVIVLSDYFTFDGLGVIPGSGDWGEMETRKLLEGQVSDPTTRKLYDCLFGKGKWEGEKSAIIGGIVSKNILLWNFLPMFRGGTIATIGVPPAGSWQISCWEFLSEFLTAVGARRVVLCCSDHHLSIPRSLSNLAGNSLHLPGVGRGPRQKRLLRSLPSSVKELFRLHHPLHPIGKAVWHDCSDFQRILGCTCSAPAGPGTAGDQNLS